MSLFLFKIFINSFRLVPMWLLYIYSDIISFILYHIVGYRKEVVFKNLRGSFPEKSDKEIKKIAKDFYSHLSDILLEGFKGFTMSKKNILKRYIVKDLEKTKKYFKENKNIIFGSAHVGNWEWGTQVIPSQLYHKSNVLYQPMHNKKIDKYMKRKRSRDGMNLYSIALSARAFYNQEEPFSVIMLGDQNPSNTDKAIWVNFLNRPTACLHGIEQYAKRYNMVVFFAEYRKIRRGHYEIFLDLITENPQDTAHGAITKEYMKKLELRILENPENWLWSHKRWKTEFDPEKYTIIE